MNPYERLAGRLILRPGQTLPTIANERPDLVDALTHDRPASELPGLLSALFALCGHAHNLTALHAVSAALGSPRELSERERENLRMETLREHLRRIWIEWPRLIARQQASSIHGVAELAHCPALRADIQPGDVLSDLPAWLEEHVFQQSLPTWLAAWQTGGEAAMRTWCESATTLPARLLSMAHELGHQLCKTPVALNVEDDTVGLRLLARELELTSGFTRAPVWLGIHAETGPWTRLHDLAQAAHPDQPASSDLGRAPEARNVWMRLVARLAEIARLALPQGAHLLRSGSLPLKDGEGISWTEMARGVLIHWVRVERRASREPRVAACRVLAPTEWNFHPQGVVACALVDLGSSADARTRAAIDLMIAAFDPCVPCTVELAEENALCMN